MPRALAVERPEAAANTSPRHDIVKFPANGEPGQRTFNLRELGLSEDIKDVLRYAIEHHPMPIGYDTQRHYWYAVKTFARFAVHDGLRSRKDLCTDCVRRFRRWLETQKNTRTGEQWGESHRGRMMVSVRELMRTVKTGKPELLPSEFVLPTYCYPEGTPNVKKRRGHLTREELTSLMWACQQDFRKNRERFDRGRKVLAGEAKETFPGMRHALLTADKLTKTGIATKQRLMAEGVEDALIRRLGHSEGLRSHLAATPRTLAPILISVLVQLAGNVDAVRQIKVNCMRIDEFDERWALIEWEKPRAGPAPGGIQQRFGDRTARYGSPAVLAMAMAMTAPIRHLVKADERDKIFICGKGLGENTRHGLITNKALRRAVQEFLDDTQKRTAQWNEQHPSKHRKQIPAFTLCEIRGSMAVQHYLASGGDIRSSQRVLNHRQSTTTKRYVEGPITKDMNVHILAEIQRQITQRACGDDEEPQAGQRMRQRHGGEAETATASFTHECRAPNHESGRLCSHFQQCLDCPGLVIPKTPDHLARLLQAQETFRAAKERLHPERWEWLYARSYATLTGQILPGFPAAMVPNARRLMKTLPPLPDLE